MTTNGTLDDVYFEWLYSKVASVRNRNPARSYWNLLHKLYITPFEFFIHNDDNRAEDGKELREEFLDKTGHKLDSPIALWMELDCSIFEMLIALAQRGSFQDSRSLAEWFWLFVQNLEMIRYTDDLYEISIEEEVEDTLYKFMRRQYSYSGLGGLFPLREPHQDQRKTELWYQMSAYLLEGAYVNISPEW